MCTLVDKKTLIPIIHQIVVAKGIVDVNCYVLGCPATKEAAVIDPGAFNQREVQAIQDLLARDGLTAKYIINTHGHIDHIAGNRALRDATGARLCIHEADAGRLGDGQLNGSFFFGMNIVSPEADILLKDSEMLKLGDLRVEILHTPGHTPGGICLRCADVLFAGDTLFAGSVGRTDLPGGDEKAIIRSIKEKLLVLPETTSVRPGHGPRTTIGNEKADNPFLT
jgi:hydroxyacylglutathione hydrolase